MDSTQELKIVRWSIIITIVISVMSLVIHDLIYFQTHESTPLDTAFIESGFGKISFSNKVQSYSISNDIYQDYELGFQILKPNDTWKVIPMSDNMNDESMEILKTKGFLDGIYLEQNNEKHFMIAVFDVSQKSSFELANYVDTQIETMKNIADVDIQIRQVSQSNDWAIFGAHAHSENIDEYGEQLLYLENNRLYMLQYTGLSPSEMKTEIKSEYRSILDSFKILG
ncbi:hypothetical protein [Nitrosarchaeum koreense]|uniref:Uncharacterized protein n=1 Tax=Nitrosarchaeum koreense MY1 TaxID=1001994 RepID=F9CVQ1_9ARCH|nr:hypothetical protein [Nitrosarchaeum koreense]EGP93353.1 hypothetical protein MY1_0588 [Nitrosarchaeum koreense MY1]